MKHNILITICARGGSKGIPGKNIKAVGGVPLIAYTAQTAIAFASLCGGKIILSTDSDEILKVGAEYGLPTDYVRPDFLADDTCGKPDAIRHALEFAERRDRCEYDIVVDLDVTSPIRTLDDIQSCCSLLYDNPDVLTSFSVSPASRNPYFNMVEVKEDGYCKVVLGGIYKTRQSAPKVYDMNASVYAYRRAALLCDNPRAVTPHSKVYVMNHICFDLDEPADFDYLSYLVDTGKINLRS